MSSIHPSGNPGRLCPHLRHKWVRVEILGDRPSGASDLSGRVRVEMLASRDVDKVE